MGPRCQTFSLSRHLRSFPLTQENRLRREGKAQRDRFQMGKEGEIKLPQSEALRAKSFKLNLTKTRSIIMQREEKIYLANNEKAKIYSSLRSDVIPTPSPPPL